MKLIDERRNKEYEVEVSFTYGGYTGDYFELTVNLGDSLGVTFGTGETLKDALTTLKDNIELRYIITSNKNNEDEEEA